MEGMGEKAKLVKVQFWVNEQIKKEIDEFARSLSISASLVYKAGAYLLKNRVLNAKEENLIVLTKSWKDFQSSMIQKKIHESLKESRGVY